MIRKYQNELIVLAALLFLLAGVIYQHSSHARLESSLAQAQTAARQITETKTLEKVWSSKGIRKKLSALHESFPKAKVKSFELGKKKLEATFVTLSSQELNALTGQIASLPVKIEALTVARSGNTYTVGCQCRW